MQGSQRLAVVEGAVAGGLQVLRAVDLYRQHQEGSDRTGVSALVSQGS